VPPAPVIRPAGVDDVEGAADVYLAARHAAVPAIPPMVHTDDEVRAWFRTAVWTGRETWVAVVDATVVGILVLDGTEVEQLYVAPGRTGQELGSRLLDQAKALRPGGLALWVFAGNVGARRFYERHGFVEIGGTDGSGNEEGAPDVRCAWPGPQVRWRT